jgi:hypothetical protein
VEDHPAADITVSKRFSAAAHLGFEFLRFAGLIDRMRPNLTNLSRVEIWSQE